jgi:DNA-binding transcriptional MocR family regulator
MPSGTRSPEASGHPLYLRIAGVVERQVRERVLRVGERVPSVRALSVQQGVSISTVLQAYSWLERRGYIEARPRSGYYVRVPYEERAAEPETGTARSVPCTVEVCKVVTELMRASHDRALLPLGGAVLSSSLVPSAALNRTIRQILRRFPEHSDRYESRETDELRRQLARRALAMGCSFAPGEITVTCGAMEGLNLCLRAVASPGDVVAVESPSYFGLLQAIESLGLRALEIPTHPRLGLDLEALERQLGRRRVRAVLSMPSAHNPLGYSLNEDRKRELVELVERHDVPLIEDDVYGDLAHGGRPRVAKAFDRSGLVLVCSSFSKVLGAGYRVGWVHGGRFAERIADLKSMTSISSPALAQHAIAGFLAGSGYERHLRRLRAAARCQIETFRDAVCRYFPEGTRASRPDAGFLLWVQLPGGRDGFDLYRRALGKRIAIMPGAVFSAAGAYRDHVRLNCGHPWSDEIEEAIRTLGRLAGEMG